LSFEHKILIEIRGNAKKLLVEDC